MLTNTPVYCGIEPDDSNIPDYLKERWMKLTKDAVFYWQVKLQTQHQQLDRWNMLYVEIPVGATYKSENCDIEIKFIPKPVNYEDWYSYLGYYCPSVYCGKAEIVITYLEIGTCDIANLGLEYCYKDAAIRTDVDLASTMSHELGHSLGLGHYTSNDPKLNYEWTTGENQPPSIMAVKHRYIPQLRQITQLDIDKVHEMYGEGGFLTSSDDKKSVEDVLINTNPTIKQRRIFETLSISNSNILVGKYELIKIEKISGTVFDDVHLAGHPVFLTIIGPNGEIETVKVRVTGDGYFEYPLTFDGKSTQEIYHVEPSYMDFVDISKNLNFEVGVKSSETTFNLAVPKQSLEQKEGTNEDIDKNEIPKWIQNNAKWWADEVITDKEFVRGIEHLAEKEIIKITNVYPQENSSKNIPFWIKNTAKWWTDGVISDDEFLKAVQHLASNGIIKIKNDN